jgi:GGDEF domain-containing protein
MSVVDQHHALRPGQTHHVFDTFCLHMLESGQPLRIDDTTQASMSLRQVPQKLEIDVRAYVGVPLYMTDGRVFGSLWAADNEARHFTNDDVALLQLFARLLTPELMQAEQTRHSERIEQARAMHINIDPSTGLLDKDGFAATLARESARRCRYGNMYAVATLMTTKTDSDPHALDTFHKAMADILMRTSRLVDCCARTSDNTFAVLFAETDTAGVLAWRKRIEAAVEAWNRLHSARGLTIDVGIGIADSNDEPAMATAQSVVLERATQYAMASFAERRSIEVVAALPS